MWHYRPAAVHAAMRSRYFSKHMNIIPFSASHEAPHSSRAINTRPDVQQPVMEIVSFREDKDNLRNAIKQLPLRLQFILYNRFWEELSYRATGKLMGISRTRVCQLEAKAIKLLHQQLQESIKISTPQGEN